MKSFSETNWSGWNISANEKGDPTGQSPLTLLRMDNLNMDSIGTLRKSRGDKRECINKFSTSDIYAVFSTYLNGAKTRFVYCQTPGVAGSKSVYVTSPNAPTNLSTILVAQAETSQRCDFLNALGQVFYVAGGIQYKYDGSINFAVGIPAPAPPTIVVNATNSQDLSNLDGSGNYTNWASISEATYSNAGTNVNGTAAAAPSNVANIFSFKTAYSSPIDTTNLGGTGEDTPDDLFTFNMEIDDATQLVWVHIELWCDGPTPANYFWKEWDFTSGNQDVYAPFNISSGIKTPVILKRSDFFRVGTDATKGWGSINGAFIQFGISGSSAVTWDTFKVAGGALSDLSGTFNYVAVQVNNTGGFLEFSPASAVVSADATIGNITLTPAGAVNAQCNQYWLFRQDVDGGNYYLINIQTSFRGFTPSTYLDYNNLDDLIQAANINPQYVLQYYRQALPTNILSMIWFRDRIIYLTTNGFIPSYKLDPGSYDARFVYEIIGSNSESCLFIVKLDVGTFIIATTRDFYRVTGTFSVELDPTDPTGTVQYQDVTITPLGISDPAVSRAFVEYQGSILYVSSTGIRVLNNATSTLINDNLDLLFRNETRYDLSPIQILPQDLSIIAGVSQGQRIYWSLPHRDGINRVYVLNIANQTSAVNLITRSWRLWTKGDYDNNPSCFCREEDGTILFGSRAGPTNYISSIETDETNLVYLPIKIRTQFNYGSNPAVRKDALGLKIKVNTGNNIANLLIYGLQYDGSIKTTTVQFSTQGDAILHLDVKEQTLNGIPFQFGVDPAIAYAFEISCYTNIFSIQWLTLTYEERPVGVRRAIIFSNPLDKTGRKRISSWSFVADPMGLLSNNPTNITAYMTIDGVLQPTQVFSGVINNGPQIFNWECDPTKDILGYDWQLEIVGDEEFEFYKFLPPIISQETPPLTNQVISPANNFGDPGRKRLGVWPFRTNLRGSQILATCRVDGSVVSTQSFSGGDFIDTYGYIPPDDILGVDWELELNVTSGIGMEFYGFGNPNFTQQCPEVSHQAIMPTTNFDSAARKRVSSIPFVVNMRNSPILTLARVDGIDQREFKYTPSTADEIQTIEYIPPKDLLGVDWQLKVYGDNGMEFYKFLQPIVSEPFPVRVKHAIQPYTNFGKASPKKILAWPFIINTLGNPQTIRVSVDGTTPFPDIEISNNRIETMYWHNPLDLFGIDWQIEVIGPQQSGILPGPELGFGDEFEFYKFLAPEMAQIFPMGKLVDQIGPLDLNAEGLVFGARFRIMGTGIFHYIVYTEDTPVYENDVIFDGENIDKSYLEKFPKNFPTTTCRIVITSSSIFYRFSVEYHVRSTGKESEGRFVMVSDPSSR